MHSFLKNPNIKNPITPLSKPPPPPPILPTPFLAKLFRPPLSINFSRVESPFMKGVRTIVTEMRN